ncbi:hypothetical protein ScalyP_jg45, partial [Parmales sp. scaly parma]
MSSFEGLGRMKRQQADTRSCIAPLYC